MMRILISRMGALGDMIMITPLLKYLKSCGHEVYVLTSNQGMQILENNPNVDKLILHEKDSVPPGELDKYLESVKEAYECEKHIGLSESIEVNVALHPSSPRYKYPKYERREVNYYEETFRLAFKEFEHGSIDKYVDNFTPEMFFTDKEHAQIQYELTKLKTRKKILWGLSGSARNKVYPHVHDVIHKLIEDENIGVITVGDEACRILEFPFKDKRIMKRSGKWKFRQSALACKYVDLVVSPDTGLLHASGCFETPKVGLLGHTTIEEITRHFKNDFSIEASGVGCSPCHQIHYSSKLTCNLNEDDGRAALCMSQGLPSDAIYKRIKEALCLK